MPHAQEGDVVVEGRRSGPHPADSGGISDERQDRRSEIDRRRQSRCAGRASAPARAPRLADCCSRPIFSEEKVALQRMKCAGAVVKWFAGLNDDVAYDLATDAAVIWKGCPRSR